MRSSRLACATVIVAIAGAVTACGTGSSADGTGTGEDTSATMSLGVFSTPTTFDPVRARAAQLSDSMFLSPVYDQLLVMDTDLQAAPGLASEWVMSDDGMALTLELRSGVTFQDGSGFDSSVVKANLDRARTLEGSTVAGSLASVSQVVAEDPDTVRVEFSTPSFSFPYVLASNASISSMVSGEAIASGADLSREPAGSGPFTLTNYGQDRVTFTRDDDYWDQENLPALQEATIIAMPDDNARLSALQSGQLQVAAILPNQNAAYTSLVDSGRFQQLTTGGLTYTLHVNNTTPGLDDPRVRKALSLAIDRETISEALFNGEAPPAFQFQIDGMDGYVPEIDASVHYDPERAKALLAEAGATDLELTLMLNGTNPSDSVATVVMDQLARIGISVTTRAYAPVDAGPAWRNGEADLYVSGALLAGDPTAFLERYMFGPFTLGKYEPDTKAAYDAAMGLQMDDPTRADAFAELASLLDESPIHVSIVRVPSQYLASNDVTGLEEMTFSQMSSTPEIRVLGRTG